MKLTRENAQSLAVEAITSVVTRRTRHATPISFGVIATFWHRSISNFGDQLAPVLLSALTGLRPVWVRPGATRKVLSTGSILHRVRNGDVVIGTGAIESLPVSLPADVAVFAVRGPLTRDLIASKESRVPAVYGDPAMLLPRVYTPSVVATGHIALVPHHTDHERFRVHDSESVRLVDVKAPWRSVADEIARSSAVVSSSLHGIIVAEAYGKPAVFVRPGPGVRGAEFKFRDYFLGTGREPPHPLTLIDSLELAGDCPPVPPRFNEQLDALTAAFSAAARYLRRRD